MKEKKPAGCDKFKEKDQRKPASLTIVKKFIQINVSQFGENSY